MTRWIFDGTLLPSGQAGRREVGDPALEREIDDGATWVKLIEELMPPASVVVRGTRVR